MNGKDIRWKQRFENFSKAFKQLDEAIKVYPNLSDLEKEGLVQRFEYTFELAWKTLKDYLESKGVIVSFPRDVIKEAFAAQVVEDGSSFNHLHHKGRFAYGNIIGSTNPGKYPVNDTNPGIGCRNERARLSKDDCECHTSHVR